MKLLHTADWHLDTPFSGVTPAQRELLRRELGKLPGKIADLVQQEQCDLVLIAGDVFDGVYTRESLEAVRSALERMAVPVFLAPGNHDFCAPGSPWLEERWPENVHIFTGAMASVPVPELDCRVYGGGYRSMDCPPLLEGFRREGPERYHIGVLHGDPSSLSSPYCPVTPAQVRESGLNYLALGHIHKGGSFTAGDTLCAWPGCPMGRGYDETGEKGVYILDLEERNLRFLSLDAPRFYDLQVDTGENLISALEGVLPGTQSRDVYRVTLMGSGEGDVTQAAERFAHLKNLTLLDRREQPVDLWAGAGEDTLDGVYFQLLRQQMETADEQTARRIALAAEISRKLLLGKEVAL